MNYYLLHMVAIVMYGELCALTKCIFVIIINQLLICSYCIPCMCTECAYQLPLFIGYIV